MSGTPDVTVILPVYNAAEYIERAVDSIVRQTLGLPRIQVLLVDDGSTDESPAMLDRMAASHPSLEVTHQANSGGPAAPRNLALGRVRGRYIFFLDQDDYLSPDALDTMVRTADKNGTDVVLARNKGVGGRPSQRMVFARTIPRTDVFSSRAYWSLNPLKLFRTEMVRSLGLTFDENAPWGEDQPFVATAYLKGSGISILADKDYIFWVYRDDRSNITTSVVSLAERLPVVDRMFDLVADAVPPGLARDRLLLRHFRIELGDSAFEGYRTATDESLRAHAFGRFRRVVDAYCNENIEAALAPRDRVLMRLIQEGRSEDFADYLDALARQVRPPELVYDGHLYLELPWFRDSDKGLPDDLFDIAAQLRARCRIEPLALTPAEVGLTATCRLGDVTVHVSDVSLIARSREGASDVAFPLAFEVILDEVHPFVQVEDSIPIDRLLSLPNGDIHDLYLRVAAGATWRECRVAECAPPAKLRIVRNPARTGAASFGMLTTTPKGHLALCAVDGPGLFARLLRSLPRSAASSVRRRFGRVRA
jgi:glycosyltransferase involved in cell wall biosynthesis